jgi:hypothetical protein
LPLPSSTRAAGEIVRAADVKTPLDRGAIGRGLASLGCGFMCMHNPTTVNARDCKSACDRIVSYPQELKSPEPMPQAACCLKRLAIFAMVARLQTGLKANPVLRRAVMKLQPITSAGRFSPLGPRGIGMILIIGIRSPQYHQK